MTINEAKQHLNIDLDFTGDDEYIEQLIMVCEQVVVNRCKVSSIDELKVDGELPRPIIHAIKLFIGNLYNNRESVSFGQAHELPMSFEYLILPYVKYG